MKKNIFFLLPVFTYGAGQFIKRIILDLDHKKYNSYKKMLKEEERIYQSVIQKLN